MEIKGYDFEESEKKFLKGIKIIMPTFLVDDRESFESTFMENKIFTDRLLSEALTFIIL